MKKQKGPLRHGHARGGNHSPTYYSWECMISRCRYSTRDNADMYFDKGIKVCDEWTLFDNFLKDMGERPEGHTLDRKDGNLGYYAGNCKWSTPREQARNTRRNVLTLETATEVAFLRLGGMTCREISEKFCISESLPREIVKGRCWPDALEAAKNKLNEALDELRT